jgi:hypothetical protein
MQRLRRPRAGDLLSLFFITPDELATSLQRLCTDLRLVTLDLRFDEQARAMQVVAASPPGTAPDTSTELPAVLLFLPEDVDWRSHQDDDLIGRAPCIHLPLIGLAPLIAPRTLLSCRVDVQGRQHTPSMSALADELGRGLTSDLLGPTWVWDLAEPDGPAMAHREFRHSPQARRLYHEGWTWRQIGAESLRYGPCSPQ